MRCDICNSELGNDGRPVSYCEWQQGRCPNQKHAFDWNNKFDRFTALVLVPIMLILFLAVLYVELS
jgi:hypothetical protein